MGIHAWTHTLTAGEIVEFARKHGDGHGEERERI